MIFTGKPADRPWLSVRIQIKGELSGWEGPRWQSGFNIKKIIEEKSGYFDEINNPWRRPKYPRRI